MPIKLRHSCTLYLQFGVVKMYGEKKCLLDVIKYGVKKDIASDPRKDDLEQKLDNKEINGPF